MLHMDEPYIEISAVEAKKIAEQDEVLIVDVRQPEQFEKEHIKDSILIPLSRVKERMAELPQHKKLFFICEWGPKGVLACETLLSEGFPSGNLYVVDDGLYGCKKAGFTMEQGST